MEKLIQDGIVGIITGIITSTVLFLIKSIWDSKIKPALREIRYQGVDISGTWEGKAEDTTNNVSTQVSLYLTQSAQNLGGTFLLRHKSPSHDFEINFKVTGYIWEGYATLNLTPINRQITSYATSLLKIAGGGVSLDGQMCFRNVNEERVSAESLVLHRIQKIS